MPVRFLSIPSLTAPFRRDVGCKFIVNSIRGKTPRRIREFLGIENDWDPEEYKQIMKENVRLTLKPPFLMLSNSDVY